MNGTRISTAKLIGLLFAAAAICAAAPDYFPLQVGNSWAYRVTQGRLSRPGTINVEAKETIEGREYFRVDDDGNHPDPVGAGSAAGGACTKSEICSAVQGSFFSTPAVISIR